MLKKGYYFNTIYANCHRFRKAANTAAPRFEKSGNGRGEAARIYGCAISGNDLKVFVWKRRHRNGKANRSGQKPPTIWISVKPPVASKHPLNSSLTARLIENGNRIKSHS
jgi:hypothetical protein